MTTRTIDTDEAHAVSPPRHRRWLVAAMAVLVVAAVFWLGALTRGGSTPTQPPATAAPTRAAGEVAPGLTRGTATVTRGNTDALYGVPVGWPRDLDGAIGAGMNYIAARQSLAMLLPDTRHDLIRRLYTPHGIEVSALPDPMAEFMRGVHSMDADGNPVRNGTASPDERIYCEAYPRFGAYRVDGIVHDEAGDLSVVTLKVWLPAVGGPAPAGDPAAPWDTLRDVRVAWITEAVDLVWQDGDWRMNAVALDLEQPKPYDGRRTNQPYDNVVALLGPGWSVPADGTDQPYPGSVLTT